MCARVLHDILLVIMQLFISYRHLYKFFLGTQSHVNYTFLIIPVSVNVWLMNQLYYNHYKQIDLTVH